MISSKREHTCRVCGGHMTDIISLGELYPSDFVIEQSTISRKYSLILAKCNVCNLVQLRDTVNLDSMYRTYWYRSGLNKSMIRDLKDVAIESLKRVSLNPGDIVLDIGCNDGTLFNFIPNHTVKIGFDPATNLSELANKNCDYFVNDYFNGEDYYKLSLNKFGLGIKHAKLITSIAMFYDLPNPVKFIKDVYNILSIHGIWVIQFTDLYSMFKINAFDNICHEHLEYYTLSYLNWLFSTLGLEIFDLEYNKVNGGSLRVYVAHRGMKSIQPIVNESLGKEYKYFISKEGQPEAFMERVIDSKKAIIHLIAKANREGKEVYVLGASTKGNTLLQYFGINKRLVPFAAEINEDKFGLKTVGSNIHIISEELARELNPEYFLCLPWHFKETFINNFKDYLNNGGTLIFPLPEPHIVTSKGEFKL